MSSCVLWARFLWIRGILPGRSLLRRILRRRRFRAIGVPLMFFSYGIAQHVTRELRATRATIAALKKNVGERPVQIRCDGLDVL